MENFQAIPDLYSPLDESRKEIRLITVDRESESKEISCTLSSAFLGESENVPEYLAISYVWGDPAVTEEILVNGKSFKATTNLVAFLRTCTKRLACPIWVDAIAINQADLAERASQVAFMRQVYVNAKFCLSWLGPETGLSRIALYTIDICATEFKKSGRSDYQSWLHKYTRLVTVPRTDSVFELTGTAMPTNTNLMWDAVCFFLSLPYWERTWIYQELVVSKRVLMMHRGSGIDLGNVFAFVSWLIPFMGGKIPRFMDEHVWYGLHNLSHHKTIQMFSRLEGGRMMHGAESENLVLSIPAGLKASDPRDVVYGVLGVTPFQVTVGYEKKVDEVYLEYTTCIVENHGLTDVLEAANAPKAVENLPTWVPDLSGGLFPKDPDDRNCFRYQKSGLSPLQMKISGRKLCVSGILCEKLLVVGSACISEYYKSMLYKESFLKERVRQWHVPTPTGIPFHQALIRTVFKDVHLYDLQPIDNLGREQMLYLGGDLLL